MLSDYWAYWQLLVLVLLLLSPYAEPLLTRGCVMAPVASASAISAACTAGLSGRLSEAATALEGVDSWALGARACLALAAGASWQLQLRKQINKCP